jgi:hypothetical protein
MYIFLYHPYRLSIYVHIYIYIDRYRSISIVGVGRGLSREENCCRFSWLSSAS